MLNSYTIEQVAFSHVRLRINSYPLNPIRNGHQGLQLFPTNKEYPVSAGQTLPLNASLPCVRTPPPSYYHGRLSDGCTENQDGYNKNESTIRMNK
uniref:Uncharacterized protein n=1 Tax=Erpetoichthys calabaricus TaxID=27687 RepID=A0A8C4T1P3_ERPCA